MIVDSERSIASAGLKSDGDSGAQAATRSFVTPPPLAPVLPKQAPRLPSFITIVSVLVLAGFARLTGAPDFLVIGLFITGIAGIVLFARALQRRKSSGLDDFRELGAQPRRV